MKSPPEIAYTGLHNVIGHPTDYANNMQNNGFDRREELKIPIHETAQRKPVKVGADNMIGGESNNITNSDYGEFVESIPNSLNNNFNNMNIARERSPNNVGN